MTAFRVSSSAAGLSCTGLKCYASGYEFNTAKRSFIRVCLLIVFFSILLFGCLKSDDRSCRRLRHCSLVNIFIKYNCRFANNEVLYSEAMFWGCKFHFRHVLSQPLLPLVLFFSCAINPARSVRRYNSNMHPLYSAVNSWLTIPHFSPVWNNLGKVEAISVLGIPHPGCPKR